MSDKELILKGCSAEWNSTIYQLLRRFNPDYKDKLPTIRNIETGRQLIADLRAYADVLDEVITRFHELCPPPLQPSQTADSKADT